MFQFEIIGLQKALNVIDKLIARIADLTPAFIRIHDDFLRTEAELFATEGGSGADGGWDGWTPDYQDWRDMHHPDAPENILILEGGLVDSLTGGSGHVLRITAQGAEMGTDLLTESGYGLGAVHFEGFTVPAPYGNKGAASTRVPARKAIDPTQEDIDRWMGIVAQHIWKAAV